MRARADGSGVDLAEQLGDDRDDRYQSDRDPEKALAEHERLNGPARASVRRPMAD